MTREEVPRRLGPDFAAALGFAAELHAGQTRKGGEVPYVGHLLSVAGLVIEAGGSEPQVIAALLHDAAEDQGGEASLIRIEARFGPVVAKIVGECSDTFVVPKPLWRERKERYIAHLEHASDDAVLVSLADKLDNARAILRDFRSGGSAVWDRFNVKDPHEHLWYYGSLLEIFARRSDSWMVDELQRTVARLTRLVSAGSDFAAGRLADVDEALSRTRSWIDAQQQELASEYLYMTPGDPNDDYEYDYAIAMKRVLQQTTSTLLALETERDAIARERRRPAT